MEVGNRDYSDICLRLHFPRCKAREGVFIRTHTQGIVNQWICLKPDWLPVLPSPPTGEGGMSTPAAGLGCLFDKGNTKGVLKTFFKGGGGKATHFELVFCFAKFRRTVRCSTAFSCAETQLSSFENKALRVRA